MHKNIIILSLLAIFTLNIHASVKYEVRASWITTIGGLDWPSERGTVQAAGYAERSKLQHCFVPDTTKR